MTLAEENARPDAHVEAAQEAEAETRDEHVPDDRAAAAAGVAVERLDEVQVVPTCERA